MAAARVASGAATPIMSGAGLASMVRRNWLLAILLAAGLVLRAATQLAYRPALLFIDSIKYLFGAYAGNDPPGYQLALKVFLRVGTLPMVVAVQHLLGLAMAVALYLILRRRGVPRWLAALATAPILLDAYQLQIEQSIMPDTAFEALIVAGLVCLLWQPRPRPWMVLAAGLALGASATVRQVGEIFILPALLYVLITVPGWRAKLIKAAALCAAFALPILVISFRNYVAIKHFSLAPYAAGTIYGRAAAAADCATLTLPPYERALCPSPGQQARGPDWLDHGATSPIKYVVPQPGMPHVTMAANFSRRVFEQQPWRVASAIGRDAVKLFAASRVTFPGDTSGHPLAVPAGLPAVPALHHRCPRPPAVRPAQSGRQGQGDREGTALPRPAHGERGAGRLPAHVPARRRLHARAAVPVHRAGRAGRHYRRTAPPGLRRAAGHGHRLPAHLPQRGRGPARLGPVRVQLALPAAAPWSPCPRRGRWASRCSWGTPRPGASAAPRPPARPAGRPVTGPARLVPDDRVRG